jgi:hypothetical protein
MIPTSWPADYQPTEAELKAADEEVRRWPMRHFLACPGQRRAAKWHCYMLLPGAGKVGPYFRVNGATGLPAHGDGIRLLLLAAK